MCFFILLAWVGRSTPWRAADTGEHLHWLAEHKFMETVHYHASGASSQGTYYWAQKEKEIAPFLCFSAFSANGRFLTCWHSVFGQK